MQIGGCIIGEYKFHLRRLRISTLLEKLNIQIISLTICWCIPSPSLSEYKDVREIIYIFETPRKCARNLHLISRKWNVRRSKWGIAGVEIVLARDSQCRGHATLENIAPLRCPIFLRASLSLPSHPPFYHTTDNRFTLGVSLSGKA